MRMKLLVALVAVAALAGVRRRRSEPAAEQSRRRPATPISARSRTTCSTHTASLQEQTATLAADAEAYHALAEEAGFDYAKLLAEHRAEVAELVEKLQDDFREANPAYEEMEGVVAGVPVARRLRRDHRRGRRQVRPRERRAVLDQDARRQDVRAARQLQLFLIETSLFGTERAVRRQGRQARPRRRRQGRVRRGAAGRRLPAPPRRGLRDQRRRSSTPPRRSGSRRPQDAFTALVVMTPTMSEYFEAWKNSRFVAGDKATEKAFVAASRLQDIADILGGLVLVYDNVEPTIAEADAEQAEQTGTELKELEQFAARAARRGGRRARSSRPQEADTLGSEAQDRAEAIAGQVSQAAGSWASSWRRRQRRAALALVAGDRACACWPPAPTARRRGAPWRAADDGARRAVRRADRADPRPTASGRAPRSTAPRAAYAAELRPAIARAPTAPPTRARRPWPADGARGRRARGDAVRLAAARGAARAALLRGVVRRPRWPPSSAATPRRRAAGCCCASSAPRRASRGRAPTRRSPSSGSRPASSTPRGARAAVDEGPARRLPGAAARAARRRRRAAPRTTCPSAAPRRPRRPRATSRSSPTATPEDRGAAAARAGATRAARRARDGGASSQRARPRRAALEGFTAAPFTRGRGGAARAAAAALPRARAGRVRPRRQRHDASRKDFEIQEAVAFRTGAAAAFADLRDQLAKRDAARTDAARRPGSTGSAGSSRVAAEQRDGVAEPDEVEAETEARRGRAERGDARARGRRRPTSPTTT